MANTIRLKRGSGSDPSASDLVVGELAIRTDSGKIFTKKDNGSVAEISGGGGIDDGDKGDITVANGGDTFTIDNGVVTSAKIADGTIVNGDINASAAIAGSKISPDFGSQNITTTGNLVVDTTTLFVNASNDRVGIGTNNPLYPLHVKGTVNTSAPSDYGVLLGLSSNNDYAQIQLNGDTGAFIDFSDSGVDQKGRILYTHSDNKMAFFTASGENMSLTSSGNLVVDNNISLGGTVDGVDIATRDTLFGGLTSSSGVLTNGVTATTQSAGNNTTRVATTAFVSTAINNLINGAPSALDTLNELAAAMNDNASFSTTVTNSLATKMPLAGGEFTGNVTFSGSQTVDGRDLSVDGAKLDTIESNATADQTASEILTLIKTVDGAGSGLDADTLDGVAGSSYLTTANYDTHVCHLKSNVNSAVDQGVSNEFTVNFNLEEHNDSGAFSHSSGVITVLATGWYRIYANMVYENSSSSSRNTVRAYVKKNSTEIVSTRTYDYDRGSSYGRFSNNKIETMLYLSANDTISICNYAYNEDGVITIQSEECEFIVTSVSVATTSSNADTVDSLHASSFVRSDADDTSTGILTLTSSSQYPLNINGSNGGKIVLQGSTDPYIRFRENTTDKAFIQWNSGGYLRLKNEEDGSVLRIKDDLEFSQNDSTFYSVFHEGNLTVGDGGLTQNNFTNADHSKLDGIESGATADQSNSEIKTAYEANSNTNAFTDALLSKLNGIAASATNVTNNNQLTNGAGYITATLTNEQVQDIVGGMVSSNTESGITVTYQDGDGTLDFSVASQTDNNFTNADHSKLDGIESGATADQTASEILTLIKTVDGSGSGLDADTLDSLNAATTGNSARIVRTNSSGYIFANYFNTTPNDIATGSITKICAESNNDGYIRHATAAAVRSFINVEDGATADQTASEILTLIKTVDGTTSGLDADTLDGAEGASFLRSDAADTFSGDLTSSGSARILLKKTDNNTADHLQFYNGTTRTGEIGSLDDSWLRINQETNKNIYTPRYIRADNGFFVDGTSKGINGSGNFIGGTIAGASDYSTLLRSDTADTASGDITFSGGAGAVTIAANSDITFTNGTWSGNVAGKIQHHSNWLYLNTGSNGIIIRGNSGVTDRWYFRSNGNFEPAADSSYNIGASSARVLNGYFDNLYGSGANITSINASNISSGTIAAARVATLNQNTTGTSGGFTAGNASNLNSGTIPDARFPSTLPAVDGSNLTGISAGATGGGSDEVFYENSQTVTTNYTITNGKNAMSAGPITINSGVTVTVGSGETLTIV